MGYQALLFCPDEKTARTVTQVLSELDFVVTPCTEPFAAVKKLMGEHFDAVVVDCDNEQNATLLFKSARNTSNNQSALAVAVVEGQAGVAKAFRIGANLVLTKPINVEQAKGTLRVARGLLRKNEAAKPAAAAASANPAAPESQASTQAAISSFDPARPAPITPPLSRATPSVSPAKSHGAVASASTNIAESRTEPSESATEKIISPETTKLPALQTQVPEIRSSSTSPKTEMAASRAGFGMNAGSAPAPAREPKTSVSTEEKLSTLPSKPETIGKVSDHDNIKPPVERESAPAPMFTFGGTVGSEAESSSGGKKKLVLAVAAVVLIVAGAYAAWTHWGRPNDSTPVPDQVAESPVKTPVPVPQAAPSQAPLVKSSAPNAPTTASAEGEDVETHPSKITAATDSSKPSPSSVAASKAPATKEDAEPIVIKNSLPRPTPRLVATTEAPAPPTMAGIAPAGNGGLPNLMDSQSQAPTPVLQTVTVSQGVSQGLLVKKVQPKYPPSALRLRVEGAVQLLATISKNGDISAVKILTGDTQLSHAAVDAVKQWKYKPYLLNGEPVEIQTQITVNFKLPN
jgi:protein TonB